MRQNPPAKWVLPDVVHPTETVCFQIKVPKNKYYIAAFRGAMQSLASAYKWQDNPDHTAKEVAQVWRTIADEIEKCGDKPDTKFVIIPVEDYMSICQQLRFHDGKLQGLCGVDCDTGEPTWEDICGDQTLSGNDTTQETDGTRPTPGQSKCYTIALSANDTKSLPIFVTDGDVITFSDATGAWSDGTPNWFCPDGSNYLLGACMGSGYGHDGGDPDATEYHMQLIARVNGVYYPANTGSITIPDGTGPQTLYLQANDGTPSDNQGSIKVKVCVENGATPPTEGWCKFFDFTVSAQGWTPIMSGATPLAIYNSGSGWVQNWPANDNIQINSPICPPGTTITRVEYRLDVDPTDPGPTGYGWGYNGDGGVLLTWDGSHIMGLGTFPTPFVGTGAALGYDPISGSGHESTTVVTGAWVYGTGANPFGSDNC